MNHINSLVAGVRTGSDKVFSVVNPYSKETIAEVSITSGEQIALAVFEAKKEVQNLLPAYEIHSILMAAAALIRQRSDDSIKTLVQETGFSVADARGEISRGLDTLVTSAEEAKRLRGDTVPMNANPAQDHRLSCQSFRLMAWTRQSMPSTQWSLGWQSGSSRRTSGMP